MVGALCHVKLGIEHRIVQCCRDLTHAAAVRLYGRTVLICALVFYYRNYKNTTVTGSLITLAISFAVIVLILWGLEPGFVELGGYFDYFFVNVLGVPYNVGVVVYAVLTLAAFGWCIYELHRGGSDKAISWSFFLSIFMSGIPFIGESMFIPVVILVALGIISFCSTSVSAQSYESYVQCEDTCRHIHGIDLSHYQGLVFWCRY